MHGGALVFMVSFWGFVLGLIVFVFCRLYCPGVDFGKTSLTACSPEVEASEQEREEIT